MLQSEILHLKFDIGMTHRKRGQRRKHVKRTEALRRGWVRIKDGIDKAENRKECRFSAATDELAKEGRRRSHRGGIILIFIYREKKEMSGEDRLAINQSGKKMHRLMCECSRWGPTATVLVWQV
jgi:hypothetical protein